MTSAKGILAVVLTGVALLAVHVGGDASPSEAPRTELSGADMGLAALLAPMRH